MWNIGISYICCSIRQFSGIFVCRIADMVESYIHSDDIIMQNNATTVKESMEMVNKLLKTRTFLNSYS